MKKRILAVILTLCMVMSMAACKSNSGTTNNQSGTNTDQGSTGDSTNDAEVKEVTLTVVDWSDSTKARREEFHKQFEADHPGVTIDYTCLTQDQFKESVLLAIQSGDAPDLFPLPSSVQIESAVEEDWFYPLNDLLGEEFFDTFSEDTLNEGVTSVDDVVYALPESANIINTMMFYNKTVLADAGVTELPTTWSEFIDACKQVTEAGKGKYFGIIDSGAQTNRLELAIRSLASTAGGKTSDISQIVMVDGSNTLNSDAMVSAFDFYNTLVQEECFHPDSVTLSAPEARALFAQNQAAFIVQGAWCISTWRSESPDLDFGVMALPVPDEGQTGKAPYLGAKAWMGISRECENPELAAEYLKALYSEEYQTGLVSDGGFVSVIDSVNESITDEVMLEYYNLNNEAAALAPDPIVANPDTASVYSEVTAISPGLGEIVQGVLAQSVDYKEQLKSLSEKTQAEWERAIEAVAATGVEVSKEDFEFENWDPMVNYTADLYEERANK